MFRKCLALGLVDPSMLRQEKAVRIEPTLFGLPSIHPAAFRKALDGNIAELS